MKPDAGPSCIIGGRPEAGGCAQKISLDSVGYLPGRIKHATLVGVAQFNVKRNPDGAVVFQGEAPLADNAATGEEARIADFSAVHDEGTYYLEVTGPDGTTTSPQFRIAADVYDEPLRIVMLGLHGQRCGGAVSFDVGGVVFAHDACHLNDAYASLADRTIRPGLHGWHDAGDYGKYVTNGAFAVGLLFKAWEHFSDSLSRLSLPIPEHGGKLPDFLAEAKWEVDWLLSTQIADGSASHKLTAQNFEGLNTPPERDTSPRFFTPIGTSATAELSAALAAAARIYMPYDEAFSAKCLSAAQRAYDFLKANPEQISPDLNGFQTGGYQLPDGDPRLWASAEMFETTGAADALEDVEARLRSRRNLVDTEWDWGNPGNLGAYTYLLSAREGRDASLVSAIQLLNEQQAVRFAAAADSDAYGRAGVGYYWGSNGTVARVVMNLAVAYRTSGETRYLDAAVRQIDHLFGRNFYARSQVTGVGDRPPYHPHHRPSVAIGRAWPGLLVGGGNPGPTDWVDSDSNYQVNEVAINWNAALAYALAAFASKSNEGMAFHTGPFDAGIVYEPRRDASAAADGRASDARTDAADDTAPAYDASTPIDVNAGEDAPAE